MPGKKNLGGDTADQNSSDCQEGQTSGDPINNTTGNLSRIETDYVGAGAFPLVLRRAYNSQSGSAGTFGVNWSHSYSARIHQVSSTSVEVIKADQKTLTFSLKDGLWRSTPDTNSTLESITDTSGAITGWRYTTGSDLVETYDATGKLLTITTRAGLTQRLRYNAQGRLTSVTDPFGRTLTFAYDTESHVSSVTDPAGGTYSYAYDGTDNLSSMTGPDGTTRFYLHNDPSFPHALTGLIDEKGVLFATWTYDSQGRAMSSEHADGVDKVSVNFINGITAVTDALDRTRSYGYTTGFDVARTARAEKPSTSGETATSSWSYDANGNIKTYIDYRGHRTELTYDLTRNLEISRTEGAGTSLERMIATEWHPTFRLPIRITEPNRAITFAYDADGNLTLRTVTAGDKSRTWSFQYNGNGQITQIDGPRTDLSDITQYVYDERGNLIRRTDASGHVTRITHYDDHGRPLTIVDPNGLITTLGYDPRGRLVSRQVGRERTTYTYDGVGQLLQLTRPDGSFLRFDYDDAHRMTAIADNLRNTIRYIPDAVGNPTVERVYDPQGTLTRMLSRAFDALNRVERLVGAQGQTTSYDYDDNDNLIQLRNPLGNNAQWSYDALDRLETSTDLKGSQARYGYDANDQLISLTDALEHQTAYRHNGLDDQISTTSPDTGLTQYTYDEVGNVVSRTDARGQRTTYRYDALNRVRNIDFSDGAVAFTYDQGTDGIGQLTQMTDNTGTTRWRYDAHGRVLRKTQQVANRTFVTKYRYDANGRLVRLTYPSGRRIRLTYTAGQITQISAIGSPLLRDIQYQPLGPVRAWVWGNGTAYRRQFDLDGRLMAYDLGRRRSRQLTYDEAGRIIAYTDTNPSRNQAFSYDAAGALIRFTSNGANPMTYSLDANGNRTRLTSSQGTDDYTYAPASNRLLRIAGAHTNTYAYDDAGNVTSDGTNQFVYDGLGRLIRATNAQDTTRYRINGLGQRVAKSGARTGRYFVYDEASHLLGEYDLQGRPIQETVYLGDMPVVVLRDGTRFFIYTDHLSTPRAIIDRSGKLVWRWEGDPFGAARPDEDPDRNGRMFTYNLRFPGQYFDEETGLAYNHLRYYDPQTGRYIQADPIGLGGVINPYSYVEGNPLSGYDPLGAQGQSLASVTMGFGPGEEQLAQQFGCNVNPCVVSSPPSSPASQLPTPQEAYERAAGYPVVGFGISANAAVPTSVFMGAVGGQASFQYVEDQFGGSGVALSLGGRMGLGFSLGIGASARAGSAGTILGLEGPSINMTCSLRAGPVGFSVARSSTGGFGASIPGVSIGLPIQGGVFSEANYTWVWTLTEPRLIFVNGEFLPPSRFLPPR